MRIKQISVRGLFGIFNHIIPLNFEEDRVTIIHGPNGFGKSTLLQLLSDFFEAQYQTILEIPFDEFRIDFEDETYIAINKHANKNSNGKLAYPEITYFSGSKKKSFPLNFSFDADELSISSDRIEAIIPELYQIRSRRWGNLLTGEILSLEDVIKNFGDELKIEYPKEAEALRNLRNNLNLHMYFIGTQRLFNQSAEVWPRTLRHRQNYPITQTVTKYAAELAEGIEATLAESASLSQSLDRTFPTRLLGQNNSNLTEDEIGSALAELETKRSQLREVGLLDKEENLPIPVLSQIDSTTKQVLSLYIEDIKQKLGTFDAMLAKIQLFKEIINDRFKYKKMIISKEKGFFFSTNDGQVLSPTVLSSGEQHKIVILYELLFKVRPNSLILIDEPEISLHVEWQVNFLPELQQVTQLASLDVLMATHSPDIINDRWDLTRELKGPAA